MTASFGMERDAAVADALDRFFESYYRLRPVNATFTGVHLHDHRLPDWSPPGLEAQVAEMSAMRDGLRPLLASHPFHATREPDPEVIDLHLADAFLEIQIAENAGEHFVRGNPSLWTGELAFSIVGLITREFEPAARRAESLRERLRATPSFLADARKTLVPSSPESWWARARRECEGIRRLLGAGLDLWLDAGVSAALSAQVRRAADDAITAVDAFAGWMLVGPGAATNASLACGEPMLDLLIRRGHWCDRASGELLAEVREQLDLAGHELDARARRAAPGGWTDVQRMLADLHPAVDEYLPAFTAMWNGCHDLAVADDLVSWPDWPIRYVPIPLHTREAAPLLYYLFYRSPAPFDAVPVHEYVVTPVDAEASPSRQEQLLRATNDSVIKLNHVVHHGAIGHHVQNWFAYHRARSRIGVVAAVDCASRIGMFSGGTMAEGWACYATELMEAAGFLTELECVAEAHTRVRLLARAVVDLSMHTDSMSLDAAATFYVERTGMSAEAARNEAVKNSMFPGTALMYWLGTTTLRDLRTHVSAEQGDAFSLRAFHDELLSFGSIPAPMIARCMEQARSITAGQR